MNQLPPVHHTLEACDDALVDETTELTSGFTLMMYVGWYLA